METRKISVIANDIFKDWQKVNFAALPYLKAMCTSVVIKVLLSWHVYCAVLIAGSNRITS